MSIALAKVARKLPSLGCLPRFRYAAPPLIRVTNVKVGPFLLQSAFNQVRCKAQLSDETASSAEKAVGDSNAAKVRKMRVALWVGYTGTDFKGASTVLHCPLVNSASKPHCLPC